jgi:integrase
VVGDSERQVGALEGQFVAHGDDDQHVLENECEHAGRFERGRLPVCGDRWRVWLGRVQGELTVAVERRRAVHHNLIDAKGGAKLETPKTTTSRRVITLSADTVAQLEVHKERQQVERKACRHWQGQDAIFCTEAGTHVDPSNLSKLFRVLTIEAKVSGIRLHDLRHTAASLQIRQDSSPKEVADRLGHTDPGFTSRVYTHIYDDQREAVAHSMDALLGKAKRAMN